MLETITPYSPFVRRYLATSPGSWWLWQFSLIIQCKEHYPDWPDQAGQLFRTHSVHSRDRGLSLVDQPVHLRGPPFIQC
jgi:hypothetical protein